MSDITPPPQFVQYPRGQHTVYGSAEKLQALGDVYFGFSNVFAGNVLLLILLGGLLAVPGVNLGWTPFFAYIMLAAAVARLALPLTKKLAFGKDWPDWSPLFSSVVLGLSSVLCCGIVGYAILQSIAAHEIKKYGLGSGFLGVQKKQLKALVLEMKDRGVSPPFVPPV